jgi:hypothetical protein
MWFELTPADYPHDGLSTPGWTHVSPDGDGGSRAYILESILTGSRQGYFLAPGETSLDVEGIEFGPFLVKCINGFVYLVTEAGIAPGMGRYPGYMQLIEEPELLLFCSYYELLVIHKSGMVRYFRHEDYYYADVLELIGDTLHLSGWNGKDEEPFTMRITDFPVVQVKFR